MLTLQSLKDMPQHSIFATGIAEDNEEGLFLMGTGKPLRWVAVRGGIHDWAIYAHHAYMEEEAVARIGDKVHDERNIKKLVPCDDEAFAMYRH